MLGRSKVDGGTECWGKLGGNIVGQDGLVQGGGCLEGWGVQDSTRSGRAEQLGIGMCQGLWACYFPNPFQPLPLCNVEVVFPASPYAALLSLGMGVLQAAIPIPQLQMGWLLPPALQKFLVTPHSSI